MEQHAHPELAPAWQEIQAELRRLVGQTTFEIWLAPIEIKSWDGSVLLLQAPPATEAWVAKRFGRILENCTRRIVGSATRVMFAGGPQSTAAQRQQSRTQPQLEYGDGFNPRYTFDQFIIGDGNRLAHGASLTVAELPGQAFNPLFLYAPPGLGKTHLLHAIGNYVLAFGAGATVRYTTVESFTNEFISALGSRSLAGFKHAYRDADVLLIDDVQFLESKVKTEEEFFHTFNALYETGRQLVLTCDRLPRQLVAVEERLRERFESGLVADIRPPDFSTRVAMLRKRAELDRIEFGDPAVLELIAERITANVRALEGALIRVVAYHSLTGRPIDAQLTRTVLDGLYPPSHRSRSTADIQAAVSSYYGLSVAELVSAGRAARIAWPRQVAIHLTRKLTDASLEAIGEAFGRRSHATVLHACKRVSQRLMSDTGAAKEIEDLLETISRDEGDRSC